MTTTVNDTELPYQRVSITGNSIADTLRGAADWLDQAEKNLGEVLFVGATHFDMSDNDDQPWQFSLFVYLDEFQHAR